jgi:SAM-dependent methyltransferase
MTDRTLVKVAREQSFHPSWYGAFVNPFFIARRGLAKAVKAFAPYLSGRLLDVGCGRKPYERYFHVDEYVGLDIDSERSRSVGVADYFYDGHRFPFGDATFDAILCNQVLEHVFNPDEFLGEMHRVLRRGGGVVLTIPFVWDEHEQPYDYARYSSFGLRALFQRHGFTIEHHRRVNANLSVVFQLLNAYLYKVLPSSLPVRAVVCIVLMAPISYLGILFGWMFPDNEDLYLDQIILARKPRQ